MLDWLETHIPPWVWITLVTHVVVLGTVAYMILLERKVASWVQDRIGPNRVGLGFGIIPWLKDKKMMGLGQPLADGLKFVLKEDYRPAGVDKYLFTIAPALMIIVVIVSVAVIPWGGVKQGTCRIDVTGAADYEAAVREKLPANVVPVGPTASGEGDDTVAPFHVTPGPRVNGVDTSLVVVTYQYAQPGGVVRRQTRQIQVPDPHAQDLGAAQLTREVRAKLPAGAEILANPPTGVPTDLEFVPDPEAPDDPAARKTFANVTYRYAFQIADLNIGVLFILALLSLAVYGVVVGGWASNNKYSFLGGLRATANMISYEIPLGLSVLCIVLMFGTLDLGVIVDKQAHYWAGFWPAWNVFTQPVAFLLFLVCIHAEANRAPFDLAEAEQELVGGYHTEYSSMRFALFFLAEYAGMITTSAVCVALFFGGWHLPWVDLLPFEWARAIGGNVEAGNPSVTTSLVACLVRSAVFFTKTLGIIFIFMWVRWSLPRFRFDQLMMLAWRGLIPISLALLMMTAGVVYLTRNMAHAYDRVSGRAAVVYLIANAVLLAGTFVVSQLLPAAPETNRRVRVPNSRFTRTPLPGRGVGEPAVHHGARASVAVSAVPAEAGRMGS